MAVEKGTHCREDEVSPRTGSQHQQGTLYFHDFTIVLIFIITELVDDVMQTDKASMLDEIIEYVRFLQLQVKVLSMSRLGAARTVGPRLNGLTSEVSF